MSTPGLEPIGHLKFGPASHKPIKAGINTIAGWREQSNREHLLHHYAISILNVDDATLEKMMRSLNDGVETFLDMAEDCHHWIEKYKAGIEVLEGATARILVVAERISTKPEDRCAGDAP